MRYRSILICWTFDFILLFYSWMHFCLTLILNCHWTNLASDDIWLNELSWIRELLKFWLRETPWLVNPWKVKMVIYNSIRRYHNLDEHDIFLYRIHCHTLFIQSKKEIAFVSVTFNHFEILLVFFRVILFWKFTKTKKITVYCRMLIDLFQIYSEINFKSLFEWFSAIAKAINFVHVITMMKPCFFR